MGKNNAKARLQNKVRNGIAHLGYMDYVNASTEKIIALLESLYPECCTNEEFTLKKKTEFVFNKFLEIADKNNISLTKVSNKKSSKKKLSKEIRARNILIKLGKITETEILKGNDIYFKIKEIHPELKAFSGHDYYINRAISTFISLYSDSSLSEEAKLKILQNHKRLTESKQKRVEKKRKKKDKDIANFNESKISQVKEKSNKINGEDVSDYKRKRNKFYSSSAWRMIRYKVIMQQNGQCQLCGRTRKDGIILHVDHIVPLSKDWSKRLDIDNLQVLCEDCNMGKSNTDCIDWR